LIKDTLVSMPKINKDFSDALGFRLLSTYNAFTTEYPVEAAKIQKLYDEGFKETCYKCYPIIAEAGIDPSFYEPKVQQASDLKIELRKMFPIKKAEQPETIDLGEDDEETVASKPNPVKPGVCSIPSFKKSSPKREPVELPRPSPLKPASPVKCLNCENLQTANIKMAELNKEQAVTITRLNEQIKQLNSIVSNKNTIIVKHRQAVVDLQAKATNDQRYISSLEKDNIRLVGLVRQCQATVNDLDLQITKEVCKKRKQ
jgi:hypothetical protein